MSASEQADHMSLQPACSGVIAQVGERFLDGRGSMRGVYAQFVRDPF